MCALVWLGQSEEDSLEAHSFQEREELRKIAQWWANASSGVLALLGIGGAGKSALVSGFLSALLHRVEDSEGGGTSSDFVSIDVRSESECDIFLFQFQETPDVDIFFASLEEFLNCGGLEHGDPSQQITSDEDEDGSSGPPSIWEMLADGRRILLIIDGLEAVQQGGLAGDEVLGKIDHPDLLRLLLSAVDGEWPQLRILITSRFPIPDLGSSDYISQGIEGGSLRRFDAFRVDQLSLGESISLMRSAGVVGSDDSLSRIAEDCGRHVLIVDLATRLLILNQSKVFDFSLELELRKSGKDLRLELLDQISEEYASLLNSIAPWVFHVLCIINIFGRPVDIGVVGDLLAREAKEKVARTAVGVRGELNYCAQVLLDLGLLRIESEKGERLVGHPLMWRVCGIYLAPSLAFLRGIACWAIERSYIPASHGGYPEDDQRLDLLEELVYQRLALDELEAAWGLYQKKLGGYENLGRRLSQFRRGERICRTLNVMLPSSQMASNTMVARIGEDWAQYLMGLGRLSDADSCCASLSEQGSPKMMNIKAQLLCLRGDLKRAYEVCSDAIQAYRELMGDEDFDSRALRGHIATLRGMQKQATEDFAVSLAWEDRHADLQRPLYQWLGSYHIQLLSLLGQTWEARRVAKRMKQLLDARWDPENMESCFCILALADIEEDLKTKNTLVSDVEKWASARDVRIIRCLVTLVRGRESLRRAERTLEGGRKDEALVILSDVSGAIERGLALSRLSGFGILHIDLLITRARLTLLQGDALAAEADARTALSGSLRPIPRVGLPGMVSAADPLCGYRWGELAARQIIGEALLLRAAQRLGSPSLPPEVESQVSDFISQGYRQLESCLRTHGHFPGILMEDVERILDDLRSGLLTRHFIALSEKKTIQFLGSDDHKFDIFFCYNSIDEPEVARVAEDMRSRELKVWFAPWSIAPGDSFVKKLEEGLSSSRSVAVFVGAAGIGPWQEIEVRACLVEAKKRIPIIPVRLPSAAVKPELPFFLRELKYFDLQGGFSVDLLGLLEGAIRAKIVS